MRGSQNDSVRACVSMHLAGMLIMVRGNDGLVVRCKQDVRPTARLRQGVRSRLLVGEVQVL
jgi:hypothetical protein